MPRSYPGSDHVDVAPRHGGFGDYTREQLEVWDKRALRSHALFLREQLHAKFYLTTTQRIPVQVPDSREELITWILRLRASLGGSGKSATEDVIQRAKNSPQRAMAAVSMVKNAQVDEHDLSLNNLETIEISPTTGKMMGAYGKTMTAVGVDYGKEVDLFAAMVKNGASRNGSHLGSPTGGYFKDGPMEYVLEEAHTGLAGRLCSINPEVGAAMLQEVRAVARRLHEGIYGGDLVMAQRGLATDLGKELQRFKKQLFKNLSVVVGRTESSGDMPCFRYGLRYPERWAYIMEPARISIFFTLHPEQEQLLMQSRSTEMSKYSPGMSDSGEAEIRIR